jgi:membrane dipeptidase
VADTGGLVGVTMFPPFLPRGTASTVDDYAGIIEWMVDQCGEDHVAYGTDFTQGHGETFFEWITRDKGYGRELTRFGEIRNPKGIERIEDTPNLVAALERRRWPVSRIEKVIGLNWIAYLKRVWHE